MNTYARKYISHFLIILELKEVDYVHAKNNDFTDVGGREAI